MTSHDHQDWQLLRKTVLERNKYMFNNALMSDVKFTCGDQTRKYFNAHKYVLATSSPVFYAMFYGELAEVEPVIHLPDTDDESMEEFLRFLYTDQPNLNPMNALKVMYLANKYMVPSLPEICIEEVIKGIKAENVVTILEQTMHFEEKDLEDKCWKVVEQETSNVVTSESFLEISQPTMTCLLKRERLNTKEIELFKAVVKWCDNQCLKNDLEATGENRRSAIGDALYQISFLSMKENDFAEHVPVSGLLTTEEIVPFFTTFNGYELPMLKWSEPSRQYYNAYVYRFVRCSARNVGPSWQYTRQLPEFLCFSFNTRVHFYGVRLLGDDNGSKYKVTLQVQKAKVSGTYISQKDSDDIPGFDVIMEKPIVIPSNKTMEMNATIKGPISCCVQNGKTTVNTQGVQVTFYDSKESQNGTNVSSGQFYQLIVGFID